MCYDHIPSHLYPNPGTLKHRPPLCLSPSSSSHHPPRFPTRRFPPPLPARAASRRRFLPVPLPAAAPLPVAPLPVALPAPARCSPRCFRLTGPINACELFCTGARGAPLPPDCPLAVITALLAPTALVITTRTCSPAASSPRPPPAARPPVRPSSRPASRITLLCRPARRTRLPPTCTPPRTSTPPRRPRTHRPPAHRPPAHRLPAHRVPARFTSAVARLQRSASHHRCFFSPCSSTTRFLHSSGAAAYFLPSVTYFNPSP
ncbi:hypothetical protein C8R47DRAFT_1213655 [Mycena vitilis]|nr:hypothetical protein C8R47DRAFT_1213655 [Mycena vitilis]